MQGSCITAHLTFQIQAWNISIHHFYLLYNSSCVTVFTATTTWFYYCSVVNPRTPVELLLAVSHVLILLIVHIFLFCMIQQQGTENLLQVATVKKESTKLFVYRTARTKMVCRAVSFTYFQKHSWSLDGNWSHEESLLACLLFCLLFWLHSLWLPSSVHFFSLLCFFSYLCRKQHPFLFSPLILSLMLVFVSHSNSSINNDLEPEGSYVEFLQIVPWIWILFITS